MKKLLVLFVAVVATTLFAAEKYMVFNRTQFQWHNDADGNILSKQNPLNYDLQLTVPFVYKGTVNFVNDLQDNGDDVCVFTKKTSIPAIMTICQPCIDCFPCEDLNVEVADWVDPLGPLAHTGIIVPADPQAQPPQPAHMAAGPGWITVWKFYLVRKVDKKEKEVFVDYIDLIEDAATFFTGPIKGKAYVADNAGANLFMSGAKSDYKFKYYVAFLTKTGWTSKANGAKAKTAYIKSPKSFDGSISYTGGDYLRSTGTIKLTRNSSLTDKALKGAFQIENTSSSSNWEDCAQPANTCEEYLIGNFELDYFKANYKGYDVFINGEYLSSNNDEPAEPETFEDFYGNLLFDYQD